MISHYYITWQIFELSKKFKYRKNVTIGSLEAEKDRFLEDAFMDMGDYDILKDPENEKSIIIGRTGTGKSALIRLIENNKQNVVRLQPEAMSLQYLSNSDIISFLRNVGVNLDIFYKLLWKHVFIVEFMRMYTVKGNTDQGLWWQNLLSSFSKEEKSKHRKRGTAIEYLKKFNGEFWEQTELRIKMVESEVSTKLAAELNVTPDALLKMISGKVSNEETSRWLVQYEFKHKAQKVISELQANAIYDVIGFFKRRCIFRCTKTIFHYYR